MENMKNFVLCLLILGLFLSFTENALAQEDYGNTLNAFVKFGDNSSVAAHYEFQVAPSLTVSPEARIWFSGVNELALGGRADYYFDSLFSLAEPWDIWGGVDAAFLSGDGNDDFNLNAHIGVEYKIDDFIGIIAEFGGGTITAGGIGIGLHF
jgi:hypothetical protein